MTQRACPCCGACSVVQRGLSLSGPLGTNMWAQVGDMPLPGIADVVAEGDWCGEPGQLMAGFLD